MTKRITQADIDEWINKSKVPVYFWSKRETAKRTLAKISTLYGFRGYYSHASSLSLENSFIYVYKHQPLYGQLETLIHEMVHSNCHFDRCKCFSSEHMEHRKYLTEYHAFKKTMQIALERQYYQILKRTILKIEKADTYKHPHCIALKMLKGTKLYNECKNFIRKVDNDRKTHNRWSGGADLRSRCDTARYR